MLDVVLLLDNNLYIKGQNSRQISCGSEIFEYVSNSGAHNYWSTGFAFKLLKIASIIITERG